MADRGITWTQMPDQIGTDGGAGRASTPIAREAERQQGLRLAGELAHLLDLTAHDLHYNESLHLHDASVPVERCGYCWLRAGRALGVVSRTLISQEAATIERATGVNPLAVGCAGDD